MINCRHSRIRVLTSPKRRTFSGQALRFHYNLVPAERPAAVATFGILGYRLTGDSPDAPRIISSWWQTGKKERDGMNYAYSHCIACTYNE